MATYIIIAIAAWFYPSDFTNDPRCPIGADGKVKPTS